MKNIIDDPNFNILGTVASKWTLITHRGVVMQPTVHDGALQLAISGTSGANWHGELQYAPIPVKAGEVLTVSFEVKAEHPFTFSVWLGQQNPPHKSLVPEENHFGEEIMTSEWQAFTHTWHPFLSDESARLNFVFGQIENVLEIKCVELYKH